MSQVSNPDFTKQKHSFLQKPTLQYSKDGKEGQARKKMLAHWPPLLEETTFHEVKNFPNMSNPVSKGNESIAIWGPGKLAEHSVDTKWQAAG